MLRHVALVVTLVLVVVLLPAGCPGPGSSTSTPASTSGDVGTPNSNGTTSGGANGTDGGGTQETSGTDSGGSSNATDDATGDTGTTDNGTADTGTSDSGGTPTGALVLSGRLAPGQAAKIRPRAELAEYPFTIVAQNDQTGEILRVETGPDGDFEIEIPETEAGHSFMVTVLGPDGRAVGPLTFGQTDDGVVTGVKMERDASLGTIDLPDDPTQTLLQPGSDGDASDLADPDVSARTNTDGVPVGLESFGKGAEADAATADDGRHTDKDRDGLIDMLDADDDGDGIVDDFDGSAGMTGTPPDTRANFFMNLKISAESAPTYYAGSAADVAARLAQDTVITFEVMTEPSATRHIVSARLLETPGPAYLPDATRLAAGGGSGSTPWVDSDYAFTARTDRFDAFVTPHALLAAGDTFTVEVAFDTGVPEQYSRMLNFIFQNIPRLVRGGVPGSLTDFSVNDPAVNGTGAKPIPFDGTQDLALEFVPPLDETGAPITGMNYTFQMFYASAAQPQLNGQIDQGATWATAVPHFQNCTYSMSVADLGFLSTDDTYTVALPQAIFPTTVTLTGGTTATVTQYTIDITAECPSGNAAIKLTFVKE